LAKTDKLDANVIQAYGVALQITGDHQPLSAEQEALGGLLKRREQLVHS